MCMKLTRIKYFCLETKFAWYDLLFLFLTHIVNLFFFHLKDCLELMILNFQLLQEFPLMCLCWTLLHIFHLCKCWNKGINSLTCIGLWESWMSNTVCFVLWCNLGGFRSNILTHRNVSLPIASIMRCVTLNCRTLSGRSEQSCDDDCLRVGDVTRDKLRIQEQGELKFHVVSLSLFTFSFCRLQASQTLWNKTLVRVTAWLICCWHVFQGCGVGGKFPSPSHNVNEAWLQKICGSWQPMEIILRSKNSLFPTKVPKEIVPFQ